MAGDAKGRPEMSKLAVSTVCLALLALASTGAWANSIPPQVTLSSSTTGSVYFGDSGGNLSFWFSGTSAQCGHAHCISGNALLDPQGVTGKYWMWMVGSAPTLTGNPNDFTDQPGIDRDLAGSETWHQRFAR